MRWRGNVIKKGTEGGREYACFRARRVAPESDENVASRSPCSRRGLRSENNEGDEGRIVRPLSCQHAPDRRDTGPPRGEWLPPERTHVIADLVLVLPLVPVDLEGGDLGTLLKLVPILALLFAGEHNRHIAPADSPLALLGIDLAEGSTSADNMQRK